MDLPQAPLSMGFSRQEYWCGLPYPHPGDLPDPGRESTSLISPSLAGRITTSATWEDLRYSRVVKFIEIESRMVVPGAEQGRMESCCLKGTEFQFEMMKKSCKWNEVVVAHQCECS